MLLPNEVTVQVYGTVIQSILFGLYIASLGYCLRWLVYIDEGWKVRKQINWRMLVIAMLVFSLSIADLAVTVKVTLLEVIYDDNQVAKFIPVVTSIKFMTIIITDAVLIYRCWVVYARSWRSVIVPLLLWFSCIAFLVLYLYWTVIEILRGNMKPNSASRVKHAIQVFYSCNIANNVYTTLAIVFRITRVAKGNGSNSGYLYFISRTLTESGLLFALTSLMVFVTVVEPSSTASAISVSEAINFSIAAITFNLILIRAGQHRANPARNRLSSLRVHISTATSHDQPLSLGNSRYSRQGLDTSESVEFKDEPLVHAR